MLICSLPAKFILYMMGWSLLDTRSYQILKRYPRSMVIFSHTSFWDLIIFTLYGLAYPERDHCLRTLMTPWPFRWIEHFNLQPYFQSWIESTRVEDKNCGTINRIVRELDMCPQFVFFISPKGTLRNTPWRTGYYHIAQRLNLPIIVAGLDYETQKAVIHEPIIAEEDEPTVQHRIKSKLGSIVPLYPKGEGVEIRPHLTRKVVNWSRLVRWPILMLARFVLFMMGWSEVTTSVSQKLKLNPRAIVVFSHTSYWDFYILVLYLLAYPDELGPIRTLMKPEPFEYAGKLLRYFGAIPATRRDDSNGGSLDKIAATLAPVPKFLFFISPKGSVVKRKWRSGYYHLSQILQVPLLVAGLDYELHSPTASFSIDCTESKDTIDEFLKYELAKIVPLHPEDEIVPIRDHKSTTIYNSYRFWAVSGCILALGYKYFTM